ncbi:MAG: autotransporter outer membrane beta-barrel domain-containing protein, partial [Caulobacterales bacterium]|nr:autotransporter outer membrane beta-barrel domain-containing protein [Caulobacterales bacterium]
VDDDFEPVPLDEDDLLTGGPAVSIGGDLNEGFLNQGSTGEAFLDDEEDEDGELIEDEDKDTFGDYDENRRAGSITSFGSAPAVYISPDVDPDGTDDLVISTVVEEVRDTTDDDEDEDFDEVIATFEGHPGEEFNGLYGFINRGTISGSGINVGFDANAITIIGSEDGTRGVIIEGGILNLGAITTSAREADATTIRIGDGVTTTTLDNGGTISASILTEEEHEATAILIEPGATITTISNDAVITAQVRGDDGSAMAIVDQSGSVTVIENTSTIAAFYENDFDDDDGDGLGEEELDSDERTGRVIAIDLSANATGALISQTRQIPDQDLNLDDVIDNDDVPTPTILGDILMGAGDDRIEIAAGIVSGDIFFNEGADLLSLSGDADVLGAIFDADGQLEITLAGESELGVTNQRGEDENGDGVDDGDINLSSLQVGDGARLAFGIDLAEADGGSATFIVADTATFEEGATLAPRVLGVGLEQVEVTVITAGDLQIEGDAAELLAPDAPFLYNTTITVDPDSPDTVVASLELKTPEEIGLTENQSAAYYAVIDALTDVDELGSAVAASSDLDTFLSDYNQFLPDYSGATLRLAMAHADGSIGAVGNRLDIVRGGTDAAGGAWLQQYVTYVDREAGTNSTGFRGNGFGLGIGVDRPLGPFYAIGLSAMGSASQFEEPSGFDRPLSVVTGELGVYAAAKLGPLLFDIYGGAGLDSFDSERNLEIVPDDAQLDAQERT